MFYSKIIHLKKPGVVLEKVRELQNEVARQLNQQRIVRKTKREHAWWKTKDFLFIRGKRYNTFCPAANKRGIARKTKRKSSKEKSRTQRRDTSLSLSRFWQAKHFSKYTRSPLTTESIFAY